MPGMAARIPARAVRRGVREKDVVLAIARRLATELERQPGIRPVLTRDGDYFIELNRRREIAREAQADLFVSIHADAYRDASARGATIYVLSDKGASDEVARRLAARENASDLIGGVSLADKDPVLRQVLLDLSQNAALSASTTAGERFIDRLGTVTAMRKRAGAARPVSRAEVAGHSVRAGRDGVHLQSQGGGGAARRELPGTARACAACRHLDYFQTNAPADSYLARNPASASVTPIQHVIGRGDTLSGIAERYSISLPALKRSNSLKSDVIRVGQVLTIPQG
jgi:N-acetylmuramoyl-L-alanine amidase